MSWRAAPAAVAEERKGKPEAKRMVELLLLAVYGQNSTQGEVSCARKKVLHNPDTSLTPRNL